MQFSIISSWKQLVNNLCLSFFSYHQFSIISVYLLSLFHSLAESIVSTITDSSNNSWYWLNQLVFLLFQIPM
jgi:hypothetical protein